MSGAKLASSMGNFAVLTAILSILVGLLAPVVSSCSPSPNTSISDFLGEWINKNSDSYLGVTRLTITQSQEKAIIDFWTNKMCRSAEAVDCKKATLTTAASDGDKGVLRVSGPIDRFTLIEGTLKLAGKERLEVKLRLSTPVIGDREIVDSFERK